MMHLRKITLIPLLFISSLQAGEIDLASLSLEELMQVDIYTASQEVEKASQSPSITSVITAKQIKQWGANDIYEALSFLPGIVKNETYMGYSVLTFRGVNPGLFNNKALFMINGHPVYENLFGSNHLEYISIEMIDRIEVVRNPASALYGTMAISGVVNIITRQGENQNNTVTLRSGSNQHKYASISHHTQKLSMAASIQKDDGYKFSGTNDEFGNAVNLNYINDLSNLFIDYHEDGLRINGAYNTQEKARYGFNPWVWLNGNNEYESYYLNANKELAIGSGKLNLWLRFDNMDKDFDAGLFPFPSNASGLCSSFNIPTTPTDFCSATNPGNKTDTSTHLINNIKRETAEAQFKNSISDNLSYIAGITIERATSSPMSFIYDIDGTTNVMGGYTEPHHAETYALYAQAKYSFDDETQAILGLRTEKESDSGYSGIVPRIGLTHEITKNNYIKALYSEAYRTPIFIEKLAYVPGFLFGNKELQREQIKTFELGLDSQINKNNNLQLSAYWLKLENEITRRKQTTGSALEYFNAPGRTVYGVEFDWKSIVSADFEIIINGSISNGKDDTLDVNNTPFIANKTLNLMATQHINNNWDVSYSQQYIGEKDYLLVDNSIGGIDSYNLSNLIFNYKNKSHQIYFTIRNLFDQDYTYPEPVRRNITAIPGGPQRSYYLAYSFNY